MEDLYLRCQESLERQWQTEEEKRELAEERWQAEKEREYLLIFIGISSIIELKNIGKSETR